MSYLSWISDEDLMTAVEPAVTRLYRALNPDRPHSLEDDELLSIFENSFSDLAAVEWRKYSNVYSLIRREIIMQHERILSSIPNWSIVKTDTRRSYIPADVINEKDEIYGFLRYSPIYGDGELSGELASIDEKYQSYKFFVVAMRSYHKERLAEISEPELESGVWKVVSLEEFYDIATGVNGALKQLYSVLPQVVLDIRQKTSKKLLLSPQIFISYTRSNTDHLQKLKLAIQLANKNISAWTDEHLVAGTEDWQIEIEQQIEVADSVVLVLTPECKSSKWVRRELNYAEQQNKPIIPFWVSGNDSQVAMLSNGLVQRIDARDESLYPAKIQHLIRTIEQISRERQNS